MNRASRQCAQLGFCVPSLRLACAITCSRLDDDALFARRALKMAMDEFGLSVHGLL